MNTTPGCGYRAAGGAQSGLVGHLIRVVENGDAVAFNLRRISPGSGSEIVIFERQE